MSLMSRSIGSNSTPRPTRRTRTSVPGLRNSLGNRTAWLRPCLKILAIPVSDMDLSIDIYRKYLSSCSESDKPHQGRGKARREFRTSVSGHIDPKIEQHGHTRRGHVPRHAEGREWQSLARPP